MFRHFLVLIFYFSFAHSQKNLEFSSNGEFTILQFTDLHFCQDPASDEKTIQLETKLLQRIKPDLVVVTGDIISSKGYQGQPNYFKECWKKFVRVFNEQKIHYALALGAEDLETDLDQNGIAELEKSSTYSLYKANFIGSHDFSYYIPIYSTLKRNTLAANLWIFNSHSAGCLEEPNSWGCVSMSDINWYNRQSETIKSKHGSNIHHLAFLHQPLPEFMELYNYHEYYGSRNEKISCPLINTGLFDAFSKNKDITGVFAGHDHLNDYGGWLDDIELVYGRKTGYGGYENNPDYQKGARVIKLKETVSESNTIKVSRYHYVTFENDQGENAKMENSKEKTFQIRRGIRQDVCKATNTESIIVTLVWMGITITLIFSVGLLFDRVITKKLVLPFQKKERSDLKSLRIQKIQSTPDLSI